MHLPKFYVNSIKNICNYFTKKNIDTSNSNNLQSVLKDLFENEELQYEDDRVKTLKKLLCTRLFNYLHSKNKNSFDEPKEAIKAYIQSVNRFRYTDFSEELRKDLNECLFSMKKTNSNVSIVCDVLNIGKLEDYSIDKEFSSSLIQKYAGFLSEFQFFLANKLQIKFNLNEDQWLYIYNHIGYTLKIPVY
jgi:hypothetical protein